jgi:isopentenyl-diphosphate delta-isomerase
MSTSTPDRKQDHLDVFATGQAVFHKKTTWFEHVHLIPDSLPDFGLADIDLTTEILGKTLSAPIMITAISGGTPKGREINRAMARAAQQFGIAMGVGSQRAMLEDHSLIETYKVRDIAPDIALAGNIGAVQLTLLDRNQVRFLTESVEADWLCVHLNTAQELMQPEGDRDFSGVLDAIMRSVEWAGVPVIVKEVGCGISREAASKLKGAGVAAIDVAGAGGTSWSGLELVRRGRVKHYELETFWDWGIPTAASILEAAGLELTLLASGGIRFGTDVAKSLALGASIAGVAGPLLTAYFQGGDVAVTEWISDLIDGVRKTMLLCGCRTVADCKSTAIILDGPVKNWSELRGLPLA